MRMVCCSSQPNILSRFFQPLTIFGKKNDCRRKRYNQGKNFANNFSLMLTWQNVLQIPLIHSVNICAQLGERLKNKPKFRGFHYEEYHSAGIHRVASTFGRWL